MEFTKSGSLGDRGGDWESTGAGAATCSGWLDASSLHDSYMMRGREGGTLQRYFLRLFPVSLSFSGTCKVGRRMGVVIDG